MGPESKNHDRLKVEGEVGEVARAQGWGTRDQEHPRSPP